VSAVTTTDTAPATAPREKRRSRRRYDPRETRWAFVFLAPWLIGFLVFTGGPMIASLVLSFTDYDAINTPNAVGLENYRQMVDDPKVATALANTIVYAIMFVPLAMAVALGLAMLLNRVGRAAGFFRTVYYLPEMAPPVAVGALFLLLLNGQDGLINGALGLLGIDGPDWTTDPTWVKPGIVLMMLWGVGGTVVIYLAALRQVPQELYEAAALDGAGPWRRFVSITLPMISGALFFTMIVLTIAALQMFDQAYVMFYGNQQTQGSSTDAALFYVIYLFQQAFQFLHMGYASALAWLLFVIIVIITAIQVRLSRRFVYYESER
jgi:multiple sugar transport system permease protein